MTKTIVCACVCVLTHFKNRHYFYITNTCDVTCQPQCWPPGIQCFVFCSTVCSQEHTQMPWHGG